MKIVILGTSHPFRGGLAAYNERLAYALNQLGHDVTIQTFSLQYPQFLFPGKTQLSEEPAPTNLRIEQSVNSVNPINWLSVGKRLKKEKPDLLIVKYWLPFMGPCFGTILRQIKKNNHTKMICILDNVIPHESRPGDKLFTRYFVKPVDGYIAMSQKVFDDIKLFDNSKAKLLTPHPLFDGFGEIIPKQEALKKLNLNADFKYILFFGFIRQYKGLDLLLEAMSDERFKNEKIKLIIAGEYYADKQYYTDIIQQHNLSEKIIEFQKFITDSEVKYYFSASDLVVQPYKTATQSGVTQIAYHFNKAMIVTDVGGLAEICPDGKVGYVVQANPPEIADAILKYFNEADKDQMHKYILEEKKKYSWDILVQKIMTLVQTVDRKNKS